MKYKLLVSKTRVCCDATVLAWSIAAASFSPISSAHQNQGAPICPQAEAVPLPPPLDPPQDTRYPSVINLNVDAPDVAHRIFEAREAIPVHSSGVMTLLYPQWIPGDHAPSGPLEQLDGLVITDDGKRVDWVGDTVNVFYSQLNVPAGIKILELR